MSGLRIRGERFEGMLIAGSMKCPYCRKIIDLSAMRNREVLRCPFCRTRIIANQLGMAGFIDLMERGQQAMKDGRWLDAQQIYTEATEKNPYSYEGWFWRGVAACQFHDWAEARRCFNQASYSRTETLRILTETMRDWQILNDLLRLAWSAEMSDARDIARIFYDVVFSIDPDQKRLVAQKYINVAAAFAASGKDDPEELERLASGLNWAAELDAGSAGQAAATFINLAHLTPDFQQAESFLERAYILDERKRTRVAGELHLGAPDRMRHGAPIIDSEHRTGFGGLAERVIMDMARRCYEDKGYTPDWPAVITQMLQYARRAIEIEPQPSRRRWIVRTLLSTAEQVATTGFPDIALQILAALDELDRDRNFLPAAEPALHADEAVPERSTEDEQTEASIAVPATGIQPAYLAEDPVLPQFVMVLARIAENATVDNRFDLAIEALEKADLVSGKLGVEPPLELVNGGKGGLPLFSSLMSFLQPVAKEEPRERDERVAAICRLGAAWLATGLLARRKGNKKLSALCSARAVPLLGRPPASIRMCDALLDAAEAAIERYIAQQRAIKASQNHPYAGPQAPLVHKTPEGATPDLLLASVYLTLAYLYFPRNHRLHAVADRIGWKPKA